MHDQGGGCGLHCCTSYFDETDSEEKPRLDGGGPNRLPSSADRSEMGFSLEVALSLARARPGQEDVPYMQAHRYGALDGGSRSSVTACCQLCLLFTHPLPLFLTYSALFPASRKQVIDAQHDCQASHLILL